MFTRRICTVLHVLHALHCMRSDNPEGYSACTWMAESRINNTGRRFISSDFISRTLPYFFLNIPPSCMPACCLNLQPQPSAPLPQALRHSGTAVRNLHITSHGYYNHTTLPALPASPISQLASSTPSLKQEARCPPSPNQYEKGKAAGQIPGSRNYFNAVLPGITLMGAHRAAVGAALMFSPSRMEIYGDGRSILTPSLRTFKFTCMAYRIILASSGAISTSQHRTFCLPPGFNTPGFTFQFTIHPTIKKKRTKGGRPESPPGSRIN